jgi:hypothetical protein
MNFGGANKDDTQGAYSACNPASDSIRFKFTVEAKGSPYSSRGRVTLDDAELQIVWRPCGNTGTGSIPTASVTLPDDPFGIFKPTSTAVTLPDDPFGIFTSSTTVPPSTPTFATLPDDPFGIFKPTTTAVTVPDDPFGVFKSTTAQPPTTTSANLPADPFGIFTRRG